MVSASHVVAPPQATVVPFSELSCPTTTVQGKLVDVFVFLFGVEEVNIKGLLNLKCYNFLWNC